MHGFITHMRAKEGKREEVIALTTVMLEKTQSEEGIPVYVFATAEDSPDDFWFYDLYESQEAYDAHCATPEFQKMSAELGALADFVGMTKLVPFGPVKSVPLGR